jgi:hypothetical protein
MFQRRSWKKRENNAPEIASALQKFIAGSLSEPLMDAKNALQALIHSL